MKESSGILILNKNKKVLILRSSSMSVGPSSEVWSIPKGEIDKGESSLEAAIRETREEAGLSIDPKHLMFLGEKKYKTNRKKIFVYLYNAKNMEDINPKLNSENDKYLWASLDEAVNMVHEAQSDFINLIKDLVQ